MSEHDSEADTDASVLNEDAEIDLDEPLPDDDLDEPDLPGYTEEDLAALADLPPEAASQPPEAHALDSRREGELS